MDEGSSGAEQHPVTIPRLGGVDLLLLTTSEYEARSAAFELVGQLVTDALDWD